VWTLTHDELQYWQSHCQLPPHKTVGVTSDVSCQVNNILAVVCSALRALRLTSVILLDLRFSQWCCWRVKSSGLSCYANWYTVTNVLKGHIAFIFRLKRSKKRIHGRKYVYTRKVRKMGVTSQCEWQCYALSEAQEKVAKRLSNTGLCSSVK
jgi:hypothetical protein